MPDATTDSFKAWHSWYKDNIKVASSNEPRITKDSRENLHEATIATDKSSGWHTDALETFYGNINTSVEETKNMETTSKASLNETLTTYLGDTLCEFYDELTPLEIVQCFHEAIKRNFTHHEKEFNEAKELLEFVDKMNINA
jgi:hypothetical protein